VTTQLPPHTSTALPNPPPTGSDPGDPRANAGPRTRSRAATNASCHTDSGTHLNLGPYAHRATQLDTGRYPNLGSHFAPAPPPASRGSASLATALPITETLPVADPAQTAEPQQTDPDYREYRAAVAEVHAEAAAVTRSGGAGRAGRILARRLTEPQFAPVLGATPSGVTGAIGELLGQLHAATGGNPANVARQVRIWLLSQVDIAWWGRLPTLLTDADVLDSPELVDTEALRRAGRIDFRYRMQSASLLTRAARAARRRVLPGLSPGTAGIRFSRARPELVVLLNHLAGELAGHTGGRPAALWVTSLARSITHQLRLRSLGYPTVLPSAHCVGYAADLELAWLRRFGSDAPLREILLARQDAGDINVVDEGAIWHLCVSPRAAAQLRPAAATLTDTATDPVGDTASDTATATAGTAGAGSHGAGGRIGGRGTGSRAERER